MPSFLFCWKKDDLHRNIYSKPVLYHLIAQDETNEESIMPCSWVVKYTAYRAGRVSLMSQLLDVAALWENHMHLQVLKCNSLLRELNIANGYSVENKLTTPRQKKDQNTNSSIQTQDRKLKTIICKYSISHFERKFRWTAKDTE